MTTFVTSYYERETISYQSFLSRIGGTTHSDWIIVDQSMIDTFATATGDDAAIHTDPTVAARTRFGGTIAHGLLSLSLLPYLMRTAEPLIEEVRMGVNYGYDKVRFLTPVPVGAQLRGSFTLAEIAEREKGFFIAHYDIVLEIGASDRPALTARWLLGRWLNKRAL